MTQLDIIFPSQHFGPRRKQTPELRLMLAVLRDALDCIGKDHFAKDPHGRRLFDEAKRWFLTNKTDWPYSLECICQVLDLDSNPASARGARATTRRHTMPYGCRKAGILEPLKSGSSGDYRRTVSQKKGEAQ